MRTLGIPQRLTFVTLGARDVPALRSFYAGLGWAERRGRAIRTRRSTAGTITLALYRLDLLHDEAAADARLLAPGAWNGITLAVNFADRAAVDRAYSESVALGAVAVAAPTDRQWGGYSGYISDPEGNPWELAWAPGRDDT